MNTKGAKVVSIKQSAAMKFTIPMLPPSVNHYVRHFVSKGKEFHVKTPEANAWSRDVAVFARGQYVVGKRFRIEIRYRMGPNDGFDVDNLNKCTLDSVASAGCIRDEDGNYLSDRWFKQMTVEILDSKEDRAKGQQTEITIHTI